jgi:hypothetical protein
MRVIVDSAAASPPSQAGLCEALKGGKVISSATLFQAVLAQTWHPSATGPMGAAPRPTTPRGPGPKPSRRRTALRLSSNWHCRKRHRRADPDGDDQSVLAHLAAPRSGYG